MPRPLSSTYRLQLHAGFTLTDAAARIPYLARLGVSHLYLSPILQAAPGSQHGYDVVDHDRVNEALGGMPALEDLVARAHAHDLGVIVDIVPNHMAFVAPESLNRAVWQVLAEGRDAATAHWFDIDWKAGGGRVGLPVLGAPLAEVLASGEITRDVLDGEPVLRYHEHVYPVALGSEGVEDLAELLDRQHYRLVHWRDRDEALNYRRFFEVDGLIGVRVELDDVFDATHALLLDLNHRGLVDGFRVDHPDGLADPDGYLERLRAAAAPGTPVWVEKILEGSERLPRSWACTGTTGYDALRVVQAALVDPGSAPVLDQTWAATGGTGDYEAAVLESKRQVVATGLGPEVERLTRRAREALPGLDPDRVREAVVEILVSGEVYRAYVRADRTPGRRARQRLTDAFATARRSRPDLAPELDALQPLTMLADDDESATDFGIRLQQTWGPVMAKGVEDTTFYRWHRLVALNEVGSDPSVLAHAGPELLHDWAEHQQKRWPATMTTLSTHDTKRSEDVRARLLAAAGDPATWSRLSQVAASEAERAGVDGPTGHLVWQTILGVGTISDDRLADYLVKALREGKQRTAWVDGDPDYESRVIAFASAAARSGPLHEALTVAEQSLADDIRALTLAAKLVQLTLPGVPDVYQGCEVVDLSLVDPDNRRAVDWDLREQLLSRTAPGAGGTGGTGGAAAAHSPLDLEKLHLTTTALRLRREAPGAFGEQSRYTPLEASTEHVLGFVRQHRPGKVRELAARVGSGVADEVVTAVVRAPGRLRRTGGWGSATVELPEGTWHELLSDRRFPGGTTPCDDLLGDRPVALLRRVEAL